MTARFALAAATIAVAAAPAPLFAANVRESYCGLIRKTADGKFTTEMRMGWSLLRAEEADGVIAFDPDVTGVSCLRDPPILQDADAETLKQGLSLHFSGSSGGLTIVSYEVTDGRLTWKVTAGALSDKMTKAVNKAVERVQSLLAP